MNNIFFLCRCFAKNQDGEFCVTDYIEYREINRKGLKTTILVICQVCGDVIVEADNVPEPSTDLNNQFVLGVVSAGVPDHLHT